MKDMNNVKNNFIFMGLFLITLQSFYFPIVGPALTFIGYVIVVAIGFAENKIDKKLVNITSVFLILLSIHLVLTIGDYGTKDLFSLLSLVVMIIGLPVVKPLFSENEKSIERAIKYILIIHVTVLFSQVIFWLVTHRYLDVLEYLVGIKSGSMSQKGIVAFGVRVPRFSALFNEPGTYCITVMPLVFLYYSLKKKLDGIVFLSSISCLITMSMFGVVLVSLFFCIVILYNRKLRVHMLLISIFSVLIFSSFGGMDAVINRFSADSDYSGLGFRESMLDYYFSNGGHLIFGIRIDELPEFFVPNDIGLWFSFLVSYGGVAVVILLFCYIYLYSESRRVESLLLITLVVMTKLKYTYPLFWILVVMLSVIKGEDRHESSS